MYIAPDDQTSRTETRFDSGQHNQNNNIKIDGPCHKYRDFILLRINKTILKMISNIYFNSKNLAKYESGSWRKLKIIYQTGPCIGPKTLFYLSYIRKK